MQFTTIPEIIRDRSSKYQQKEVFRYKANKTIESLSWIQLVDQFTKLSEVLLETGALPGENIGLFSPNHYKWTITDLGIMNMGGVVVPFFSNASTEQCKYIVDETEMKIMFVGDKEQLEKAVELLDNCETLEKVIVFSDELKLTDDRCVGWSAFLNKATNQSEKLKEIQAKAKITDLVSIIYTSGTTGEPKGVMLNHENFVFTWQIHEERLDVSDTDISMAFLPLSHIFERAWTFFLLYSGATNFYLSNPREVIETMPLVKPTVMCTVPRFYEKTYEGIQAEKEKWPRWKQNVFEWSVKTGLKVAEIKQENKKPSPLLKFKMGFAEALVLKKMRAIFGGNIRSMPCAGAALSLKLLRFFHAMGVFVNYGYGCSETTATVSCFRTDTYEFDSCGTVMPGVEVKLGNENEILIKGKTVFSGYYKKPEATAEVLVDGWFKSGDKGYFTKKGNLMMEDRIKDLFKTSTGKYISPQKIETIVSQEPIIEQVVVLGDNRKFATALIVPVADKIKEVSRELNLNINDLKELLEHEKMYAYIQNRLDRIQSGLSDYEKVRKFLLISEPFSVENKMLTSTLKTRRKIIEKTFASQIDSMYVSR